MYRILAVGILILSQLQVSSSNGIDSISISDNGIYFNTGLHWKVLVDDEGKKDINDILHSDKFQPIEQKVPNFAVSKSVYWLKTIIHNSFGVADPAIEVAYPTLDKIALFKVVNGQIVHVDSAGKSYPFEIRKNNFQTYVFSIHIQKSESAEYYLRVSSGDQIILPINTGSLQQMEDDELYKDMISGMYYGIILVMILYNLFVFVSVRDPSYLYYVVFIFFVGLTQATLNGYAFKYLWPSLPWLAERSVYFAGTLSGISTIYFAKNFLRTKEFTPKFNHLLTIFIWLYVVSIVLALLGHYNASYNLINLNAGPGSLILLYHSILIYRKHKYQPAMFFSIAFSIFLFSIVVFVIKDFSIIPYNVLTVNGLQIGSAIEVTLLSFALADKINTFRKEKEVAQEEALQSAKENERIIREQNVILEEKVTERTYELNESNQNLNLTLNELKQTQTQLVESEKMASLGQLTAGIAHEINNPINFVTSNVTPLKRDVSILFDTILEIENLMLTEMTSDEKKDQIDKLKINIEYDYLKTEIEYLIKGIEEGSSRTAEIVKGLRVFSRLDEDDLKRADINEGIESTLIILRNQINNHIKLQKNYGDLPLVDCYPGKLNQVFLNIISNAIYAIDEKFKSGNEGIITITTTNVNGQLQVSIADNGIGMSDETKRKLFEPFFTTKPVGAGTGLGLSIVYNTIKKHNGNINIISALNEGSEFIIEIPIVQQLS